MRTLDQIAAQFFTEYTRQDILALLAVQQETASDMTQRFHQAGVPDEIIGKVVTEFWEGR